jgi:galactose mutarotase-like enzyme
MLEFLMYTVNRIPGSVDSLELSDTDAKSSVVLVPNRGGIATRFRIGLRDVFFLDEETLKDAEKNVRGGNPILFPNPGKLTDDVWSRDGASGGMKQHGFARTRPWQTSLTSTGESASVTLRLSADDATLAVFPWRFVLDCTYSLKGNKLRIEMRVTNESALPMPFALGFHPYFLVPQSEKPGTRVETAATVAYDNVAKKNVQLTRFQLALPEVDLRLLNHGSGRSALQWADDRVTIEASKEFQTWVVWTLAGKDFVCLEPWTSPPDALNSSEALQVVAPSETKMMWVSYSAEMKEIKPPRPHHNDS